MKNILRSSVACLVVVLCFSLVTLAANHKGVVTSKDGRQTMVSGAASRFVPPSADSDDSLTTIYDNFSRYPLGVYWCCTGYTISGPNSLIGQTFADAMPFTPSANITVQKIVVAVGYVTGTNGVTVSLNADAGNLPGAVIGKFNLSNLPTFGSCCVIEGRSTTGGAPVTAGTQYWVVVQTGNNTADTWAAWNENDTNQTTQPFAFFNNGSWVNTAGVLGGFAVKGQ